MVARKIRNAKIKKPKRSSLQIHHLIIALVVFACAYLAYDRRLLLSGIDLLQSMTPKMDASDSKMYPHSHYSIGTFDRNREFTYQDFVSVFHVEPLHNLDITDTVWELIKDHDITKDNYFIDNPDLVQYLISKYGKVLSGGSLQTQDE